jgi:predicted esterase
MDVAILHISRDEDEFYPVPVVQEFGERLRKYASDVEFHLLPGGHKFPSKGATLIQPWLRRVFGG